MNQSRSGASAGTSAPTWRSEQRSGAGTASCGSSKGMVESGAHDALVPNMNAAAARLRAPAAAVVPSRMERDSGSVTAAFHGCRSAVRAELHAGGHLAVVIA
jgi:hypothetical protein